MSLSQKSINKKYKQKSSIDSLSKNMLKNLIGRDLGLISPKKLIINSNTIAVQEINLSKKRSIEYQSHSINWLNLDNVESRYLLAGRSDGNFVCFDTFQQPIANEPLKNIFNSFSHQNTHSYSIGCIQWYPLDTTMFFTSGMDKRFKVWDTANMVVVDEYNLDKKIYNHHASVLASSIGKNAIALALDDGQIRLVDIDSGSFTHTLKAHANGHCVSAQWSPTEPHILASAGSDGRIFLWDTRSSKSCLNCFDLEKSINYKVKASKKQSQSYSLKSFAHTSSIIGLTYTNDGNYLISLGKDNTLRLWNSHNGLNTLVNYGRINVNSAVAESCVQISCTEMCSSNSVFVPSENNLMSYDILNGEKKLELKAHLDSVKCCLYNPALREVYSGSKDKNILVWNSEADDIKTANTTANLGSNLHSILANMGQTNANANTDNWSDED